MGAVSKVASVQRVGRSSDGATAHNLKKDIYMPNEVDLLKKLAEVDIELRDARNSLSDSKRRVTEAETKVIAIKLSKDRLMEEIRVFRNQTVSEELTEREKDIARFKEALPSLLENDKWNRKKEK